MRRRTSRCFNLGLVRKEIEDVSCPSRDWAGARKHAHGRGRGDTPTRTHATTLSATVSHVHSHTATHTCAHTCRTHACTSIKSIGRHIKLLKY